MRAKRGEIGSVEVRQSRKGGHCEDGFFVSGAIYGVIDGQSEVHCERHPLELIDGASGGEIVRQEIESLMSGFSVLSLRERILAANAYVGTLLNQLGYDVSRSDLTPGASIAAIDLATGEICQAGDARVAWEHSNGVIGSTVNRHRAHDEIISRKIESLRDEISRERGIASPFRRLTSDLQKQIDGEMWNRLFPVLSGMRQKDINRSFAILNGQAAFGDRLFSLQINPATLVRVIVFTDGLELVLGPRSGGMAEALQILRYARKGGLSKVFEEAERAESVTSIFPYSYAEKTAIHIEFQREEK